MSVIVKLDGIADRPYGRLNVRCQLEGGVEGTTHIRPNRASIDLVLQPGHEAVDTIVAHELTHYWLGPTWRRLPAVVEEGLCELMSDEAEPESVSMRRARHVAHLMSAISDGVQLELPVWIGGRLAMTTGRVWRELDKSQLHLDERALQLTRAQLASVSSDATQATLTSFGYLLASRIGVDRLYELCREAERHEHGEVSAQALFEAAGLDAQRPASWGSAVLAMLDDRGRHALAMQADRLQVNIDAPLLNCYQLQFLDSNGAVTGSETVERAGGEVVIPQGTAAVRLAPARCLDDETRHR